jgi:hypothetical protein
MRGRLCACRHPQGDADRQPGVRRRPSVAFVSMPLDILTLSPFPTPPLARSLESNIIGAQGASAFAAVLKETKITTLKCAATPECSLSCQRPLTLHSHWGNPALDLLAHAQMHA